MVSAVDEEIWKPVVGFEDRFLISSKGRLKSSNNDKILSQTITGHGYLSHATKVGGREGKAVMLRIHRLVAEAFLEPPTLDLVEVAEKTKYGIVPVNHKDGNKNNNLVENLEWTTNSKNVKHAFDTGLAKNAKGVDAATAFFDDEEKVNSIRLRFKPYCKINGSRAMAREFGCSHHTILRILDGVHYKENSGIAQR